MSVMRKLAATLICLPLLGIAAPAQGSAPREVLFVGNNWDGTVDVIVPDGAFARVKRINVIPDRNLRMLEIGLDPVRLAYFLSIRQLVGEGHDQFVDDMYSSTDGRLLVVSRPSFGDVVAIQTATSRIQWRFRVDGYRADHMALSPDGRHVAVSASTGNVVHVLEVSTGRHIGKFSSGDSPHENVYSRDGGTIFHASIGQVYSPFDHPWLDSTKGQRYFQEVDPATLQVRKRIDMRSKLDEAGYPQISSAVRPMTLTPTEQTVYFQLSFLHGFAEYDRTQDRITRIVSLPIADHVKDLPREQYLLDSAHHGIALNPAGTKLCVAGTMSDYATIVTLPAFQHGPLVSAGQKPYWVTPNADGRFCFVSWSGSDRVSVISYDTGQEVAQIPVGDHPQRMRLGVIA